MLYLGLLKRIVPFVLTFAAGLLLASFFVSITPNFGRGEGRFRKGKHCRQAQEVRELREENARLREQLANAETRANWYRNGLDVVAAPVIPELPPPPPPRVHRGHGLGSGTGIDR